MEADLGKVLLRMGRLEPFVDKRKATGERAAMKKKTRWEERADEVKGSKNQKGMEMRASCSLNSLGKGATSNCPVHTSQCSLKSGGNLAPDPQLPWL